MLIDKAITSLEWMIQHFQFINSQDESFVEPSLQLKEAIQVLEELKEIKDHHILIALNILPNYVNGKLTKDDIHSIILDALKVRTTL